MGRHARLAVDKSIISNAEEESKLIFQGLLNIWNHRGGLGREPTAMFRWFDAEREHRREDPIHSGSGRESLRLRHEHCVVIIYEQPRSSVVEGEMQRDAVQCQEIR